MNQQVKDMQNGTYFTLHKRLHYKIADVFHEESGELLHTAIMTVGSADLEGRVSTQHPHESQCNPYAIGSIVTID